MPRIVRTEQERAIDRMDREINAYASKSGHMTSPINKKGYTMRNLATCLLTVAALWTLQACGGGDFGRGIASLLDDDAETGGDGSGTGGGSSDEDDDAAIINLTGSTAPEETVTDQESRYSAARMQIDTFVEADHHDTQDERTSQRTRRNCRGRMTCTLTDQSEGSEPSDFPMREKFTETLKQRAILTKNGITLIVGEGVEASEADTLEYGAWMEHGGFLVFTNFEDTIQIDGEDTLTTLRGARAAGDSTGGRPSSNATWAGIMVGTPTRGNSRDNILQGDVTLTYTSLDTEIDAEFTNIKDLKRKESHSVSEVRFDNVSVGADGNYAQGTESSPGNDFIQGWFFGDDHAETGGAFEKQGIIGAFGAKKQP